MQRNAFEGYIYDISLMLWNLMAILAANLRYRQKTIIEHIDSLNSRIDSMRRINQHHNDILSYIENIIHGTHRPENKKAIAPMNLANRVIRTRGLRYISFCMSLINTYRLFL